MDKNKIIKEHFIPECRGIWRVECGYERGYALVVLIPGIRPFIAYKEGSTKNWIIEEEYDSALAIRLLYPLNQEAMFYYDDYYLKKSDRDKIKEYVCWSQIK